MTPEIVEKFLYDHFAPWVQALEPKVTLAEAQKTVLEIPVTDALNRTGGIVCGQALSALADTAMVLACGAHEGQMIPVGTVTLDTQFMRPASGDSIRAEAEITRAGKSMIFARCTLFAEPSGKAVATATATFAR